MRIWLTVFICLSSAACQYAKSPLPQALPSSPDPTAPITRIEAKNAACASGDANNSKICSCIASELYRIGQADTFKTILSNGSQCKTPESARQHAINFFKDDAERICKNIPPPVVSMTCWDGSIIEWMNPCFECPPPPPYNCIDNPNHPDCL